MREKLQIKYRKTDTLKPYGKNARTHSEKQIDQIIASIKEFGWTNPILLDGDNGIIAGHGRIMAALKIGIEEVPCIDLCGLTETQKKAYIIADNKLSINSDWDEELLTAELLDLKDLDFNLELTGFESVEISKLMDGMSIESPEEDSILPAGEQNILVRLSFPASVWIGKRSEIIGVIEKMEKLYLCQKSVQE